MVGGVLGVAEVEERQTLALRVAVEQDFFRAASARLAADQGVLPALAVARVVGERALRLRHARIVLLDPAAHLGDEPFAQLLHVIEGGGGVGVLALEMGPDVVREGLGLLEHILPVLGLEPGIVVANRLPMNPNLGRADGGDGRRREPPPGQTIRFHGQAS